MISHRALPDSRFHQRLDWAPLGYVFTIQMTEQGILCRSGETESRGLSTCLLELRVCGVGLWSGSLEAQRFLEPVGRRIMVSSKDVYAPKPQNL